MKLITSNFTISEIKEMWGRGDLVVNTTYQRSPDIWPANAKTYFIDTILEGYPFPKVYFHEVYDKARKKSRKEIVDGQQRITTIIGFLNNEIRLNSSSKNHCGKIFGDLSEDDQEHFLMNPIQADIVVLAEKGELLEMFRRMNAYTAPLNPAEKRHSEFRGRFKWFINELADAYSPLLEEFGILTSKQIIRMADAEFICELAIVLDQGIVNKEAAGFNAIYKKYDSEFPQETESRTRIHDFFETLKTSLSPLRGTFLMKSYAVHSLFCALTQKKYGIPGGNGLEIQTVGSYFTEIDATIENLLSLAYAHEIQDITGLHKSYVEACMSTTHRVAQRKVRTKAIGQALR